MNRMMMIRTTFAVGVALLGLACASGGAPRATEPVRFEIRGVVVDATIHAPVAGVAVRLAEVDGAAAATGAAGAFHIRGRALPGRYLLTATRLGYAPVRRRIRIRRVGAMDVGTLSLRAVEIQIDDLIAPECMRYDRPPADTTPGAMVRAERDSAGAFWLVCRPPDD
jgi:hypothetical protein